jgi:hypothetical protein
MLRFEEHRFFDLENFRSNFIRRQISSFDPLTKIRRYSSCLIHSVIPVLASQGIGGAIALRAIQQKG